MRISTAIVTLALLPALTGCYKKQMELLEVENEKLLNNTIALTEEVAVRDTLIESVAMAIHEVNKRFGKVDASRRLVVEDTREMNLKRNQLWRKRGKKLRDRMEIIDNQLKKNRRTIRWLQGLLGKRKKELAKLNLVVAQLESTNVAKQRVIDDLQAKVEEYLVTIAGLESDIEHKDLTIREKEELIEQKDKEINTKFYIVGTKEELMERGIIRKRGGLFGIFGATIVFKPGSDVKNFTTVDKSELSITAGSEITELLPRRSQTAYGFESSGEIKSMIRIVDPELFWQPSPFLVIMVKTSVGRPPRSADDFTPSADDPYLGKAD